jgi:hypothetical protein
MFSLINRLFRKSKLQSQNKEKEWDIFFINIGNKDECKVLFKKLRIHLHPDRFVDKNEQSVTAGLLYEELVKCRYDFDKLNSLKTKVESELGIIV